MTSQIDNIIKYLGEDQIQSKEEKVTIENNENEKIITQHVTINLINKNGNINGIQNNSNLLLNDILNSNIPVNNNLNKKENEEIIEKNEIIVQNIIENKEEEKKEENSKPKVVLTKKIKAKQIIFDDDNNLSREENDSDSPDNTEKVIKQEEYYKDEYYMRDRTYSFRPRKLPGTPVLNEKAEVNEFKVDNTKNSDMPENLPLFTETIKTKIENNEGNLITLQDQVTNKQKTNVEITIQEIDKRSNSLDKEKHDDNNDSDDNTYKEEEDFLVKEELRRSKKDIIINSKEEKIIEEKVVDIIEERKEEEEEDHDENKKKEIIDEEEAQRKYLEEQDRKKSLKKMRDEMIVRSNTLRDSVEQNKKKILEMIKNKNQKKQEENNNQTLKNEDKDKENNKIEKKQVIKKETSQIVIKNNNNNATNTINTSKIINNNNIEKNKNKNEISSSNGNVKYGEKMNAKKKQLSNTVFNRLYNNNKKKEREKERENANKKAEKNNVKSKTYRINKEIVTSNISNRKNDKNIGTIIIIDSSREENTRLNNSYRQNNHFPLINNLKKEIKSNPSNNYKKENTTKTLINSDSYIQKFLTETKNAEKSKKFEKLKHPIIFDDTENESYSFKPEINQKSINLLKKKINKRKNSSPLNKTDINNLSTSYIDNRRLDTPITESLYEDAWNKRQKLENLCTKEKLEIKKGVNKSLICKGSTNILLKKNKTELNEIIEKYSENNNGKLSIVNTIQILWEIHILQEIFKSCSKRIEDIDLDYAKMIIEYIINKNSKNKNIRTLEEIEFIEQLWIKINPNYKNEDDFIEKETLHEFLKILFSLNEQTEINKLIITLETFLKKINKNKDNSQNEDNIENNENEDKKEDIKSNDNNNENEENNEDNKEISTNKVKNNNNNNNAYNSLLRSKEYSVKEIWTISKFIRVFFELKKLLSKYQPSKKDKIMKDIIKEREKELTFQPDFNATASYFRKKNKDDNNDDDNNSMNSSNTTTSNKRRNFNKLYQEFMLKKRMHEQALRILRENKEKKEIKMCTHMPKINKHYKIKNRKRTPEVGCSRHEFLYNLNKDIMSRREQKKTEMENEYNNKELYPFIPKINNNYNTINKSFMESNKPKGSEAYIKRNRSVIQFKNRERINEQNRITGSNYEKVMNQKINLPRIKDLEPSTNISEENETQRKDINSNNNEKDNNENNDSDVYFTIQVKTSKGKTKPLKIYINKNPIEEANTFCDVNNIRQATRDKIIQKIKELQKIYKEIDNKEDKK